MEVHFYEALIVYIEQEMVSLVGYHWIRYSLLLTMVQANQDHRRRDLQSLFHRVNYRTLIREYYPRKFEYDEHRLKHRLLRMEAGLLR